MSNATCVVEGCSARVRCRERCAKHYNRAMATGELKPTYQRKNRSADDKFWAMVEPAGPLECWNWRGAVNRMGHGRFVPSGYSGRGAIMAHRWSYQSLIGDVPDGLVLDHLCRNPSCVNPWHLDPVTQQVNILRGIGQAAMNAAKTHCPQGHEYDVIDRNGYRMCRTCKREHGRASYWRRRDRAA